MVAATTAVETTAAVAKQVFKRPKGKPFGLLILLTNDIPFVKLIQRKGSALWENFQESFFAPILTER